MKNNHSKSFNYSKIWKKSSDLAIMIYKMIDFLIIKIYKMANSLIKNQNPKSYILNSNDKGVVLIIAITLLGITFSIALGIFMIFYSEYKLTRTAEYSTIAIYAADAGIERVLYNYRILGINNPPIGGAPLNVLLDNKSLFSVSVSQGDGKTYIRSRGCFTLTNIGVSDPDVALSNCNSSDSINRSLEAAY